MKPRRKRQGKPDPGHPRRLGEDGVYWLILLAMPAMLLFFSLLLGDLPGLLPGLSRIVRAPGVLLSDYLAIGGLGATLLNASLCGFFSLALIRLSRARINGALIAAVYTVIGFAFFGKNVANIWPIIAGVYLFSRFEGVPFRNYIVVALFGTTLAPLVGFLAFGTAAAGGPAALLLSLLLGLAAGFVLPPLSSHMLRFHDGYNVYNIGFTGGIVGSFLVAVLRSFGFEIGPVQVLSPAYHLPLLVILNGFFLVLIAVAWLSGGRKTRPISEGMSLINQSSGRLVSDFSIIGNQPGLIFNMGLMGLISSLFVVLVGGRFNGPVIGGILTVVGFSAFGKHPRNSCPILAGVVLGSFIKLWETTTTPVVIAGLFGTTLAPVAGQYGVMAGIAAGFFHLSVVMNVGMLHGGVNLYNNGFAGGFVAACMVPVLAALRGRSGARNKRGEK